MWCVPLSILDTLLAYSFVILTAAAMVTCSLYDFESQGPLEALELGLALGQEGSRHLRLL